MTAEIKKAKAEAWDECATVLFLGDTIDSKVLALMVSKNPYR